jgi:hypothetical protein
MKPFSRSDEVIRKRTSALIPSKSRDGDAIMLALILNAIYLQFLQAALPGISSQGAKL